MKMLSQLKWVAVLVLGTLVPVVAGAKNVDPNDTFDVGLSKLESLIQPATGKAKADEPGDMQDSLKKDLEENVSKYEKAVSDNKKELALREKATKKHKEALKAEEQANLPAMIWRNKLNQEKEANEKVKATFAAINKAPKGDSEPIDVSDKDASCTKKTNVEELDAQADWAPALQYLEKEGKKELGAMDKANQEEALKNFTVLMKKAREDKKKKAAEKASEEEYQPKIEDSLKQLGLDKPNSFEDEQRMARLEDGIKKDEKATRDAEDRTFDETEEVIKKLVEHKGKNDRLQEVMNNYADSLNGIRKDTLASAKKNAKQAKANCDQAAEENGKDNPLGPKTWINSAYQMVVAYYAGDQKQQEEVSKSFLTSLKDETKDLQCRAVSGKIENLLGSKLEAEINKAKSAVGDSKESFEAALSSVVGTVKLLQKNIKDVKTHLKKPFNDCDKIVKYNEKLKAFAGEKQQELAQAQEQQQQQQQQQQPGQPRGVSGQNSPQHYR